MVGIAVKPVRNVRVKMGLIGESATSVAVLFWAYGSIILTSKDEKWLATAWPVFKEVAAYWADYVEQEGSEYHIRQVCCADE